MKIIAERAALFAALNMMDVVPFKQIMYSEFVHISARDNLLVLTAYNNAYGYRTTVPAQVDEPGVCCLHLDRFAKSLKVLDGDLNVTVEVNDKHMATVSCGKSYYVFPTLPEKEFPADFVPIRNNGQRPIEDIVGNGVRVSASVLRESIEKVNAAIAANDSRSALTGLHLFFKVNEQEMTAVACDGYRLFVVTKQTTIAIEGNGPDRSDRVLNVVIPGPVASRLPALLKKYADVPVRVLQSKKNAVFVFGNMVLFTNLVNCAEFAYQRMCVPSKYTAVLKTDDIRAALKRVSLVACDKPTHMRSSIEITFKNNEAVIEANESGENSSDCVAETYDGEEMSIHFNHRYIQSALDAIETESVKVSIVGSMAIVLFEPIGEDNENNGEQYRVMPVRPVVWA